MKTYKTIALLALAFASASAGCAGSDTETGDDVGDDGGDDQPPGDDDVDTFVTPEGRYEVESEFDLATNLPGTVGDVVNGFIDATDGPDDPGRYLCDLAADQISSGTLSDLVHGACALAGGYINDRLLEIAPDFVDTLLQLGNDFGQIARNFGLRSELEVSAAGAAYTSRHTVNAVNFRVDGVDNIFAFASYGMGDVSVSNVGVTYDAGALGIASHELSLSYGSILRIGLDELLIPMIDPSADGLADLFHNQVDCYEVGVAIYEAIGFGSISTFESACDSGLTAAADLAYDQIANLDNSALLLGVTGQARATDTNADKKVDEITRGEWSGTSAIAGASAPLADATFNGARM
jgi:hypothetical protein